MKVLQKNRGGETICDKCGKDIEYYDDYFVETDTGEIFCEKCING